VLRELISLNSKTNGADSFIAFPNKNINADILNNSWISVKFYKNATLYSQFHCIKVIYFAEIAKK